MLSGFQNIAGVPELKRRILVTGLLLVVYRIGIHLPTPGINNIALKSVFESQAGTLFGLIDMFSGGALARFSIFTLGIMPYISSSNHPPAAHGGHPAAGKALQGGGTGPPEDHPDTRYGTIVLSIIQGLGIAVGLESVTSGGAGSVVYSPGWSFRLMTVVIAGQCTVALECSRQLIEQQGRSMPGMVSWIIPASGGGLICGCAAALAAGGRRPRMIGVQPAASPFTYHLFHHGTQEGVRNDPTLADGLSGPIVEHSITIPMMRELVDEFVLVSEESIERAIAFAWWNCGEKLEGSAAAALAAFLDGFALGPCVIVLTGGNIQGEVFDDILRRYPEPATP